MRISSISLAIAVLLTSGIASAESIYAHDAATIGEHRIAVSADISLGTERLLNDRGSLGVRGRFDFGVTSQLQLGIWAAATYGGGFCVDRFGGGALPSGCVDGATVAGGARVRVGLWRSKNDLFHLGAELGVSARPVPETVFILGLFGDANVQASMKAANVGIAYARAGSAFFHRLKSPAPGPFPLGMLAVGFEFLPGKVHPFVEGNGTLLYFSQQAGSRMDGSVLVGVSMTWGD